VWARKILDAALWERRRFPKRWPRLEAREFPAGEFRMPVVPLDQVLELADLFPQGAIVCIVRKDDGSWPDPVVHMALVVRKADGVYLRHAAGRGPRKVFEERLETLVRRNQGYRKRPVLGFNIQQMLDFPGTGQ
jgi:hypothetical protein